MDVYEKAENGALTAVCTYQIIRHEPQPGEVVEEAPKEDNLSAEEKKKLKEERAKGEFLHQL